MKGLTICRFGAGRARRTAKPPRSRARGMMRVSMASALTPSGDTGFQLMSSLSRSDGQALRRPADQPVFVIERGFRDAARIAAKPALRLEADPLPKRPAEQVDRQVAIDEHVFGEIQRRADAVAGIGGDG